MKQISDKSRQKLAKRTKIAQKILSNELKLFELSPVDVLIISVFFIITVIALHLYRKLVGGDSTFQLILGLTFFVGSIVYAVYVNRFKIKSGV
ncbi:hypothetical protein EDEG_03712 [Edhazardia aedis USNM 41457]|uniref:Uncharacterized protein n=1 Tax=Edhazardia aedis (strain USNM 41457) TaxID=1003232 RepID=J9D2J5_EDHAE|nr:hypothetical protein EDEG_03712 [Edhazardia aedis USNM 41457]|eukprot:EJW01804.1 hypothetical protein EDEG_03712 [Edhazardia aedis USNM 41457]